MTSANSARQLMSYRNSVQSPTSPVFSPGTAATTQNQPPPPLPANPPRQLSLSTQQPPPLPSNPPRQLQSRTRSPTGSTGSGRTVSSESTPVSPAALDVSPTIDASSCLGTPDISNGSCPPVKPVRSNSRLFKTPATMSSLDSLSVSGQHNVDGSYSEDAPPNSPGSSLVDILSLCLSGTIRRPLTGALIGIAHRDVLTTSAEVKAANGTVYRRNANGVYFQIVESWPAVDGLTSLIVGDEVLAIDRYKMVDMSIETARMLLEDRALLGDVTLVVARQNTAAAVDRVQHTTTVLTVDDELQQLQNGDSRYGTLSTSSAEQSAVERLVIELFREFSGKGLGLSIVGGADVKGRTNVFIKKIYPNSIAADDGRLMVGDEILAINDEYLAGLTNHEVIGRIQQIPNGLIRLIVQRPENTQQPLNNNNNNNNTTDNDNNFSGFIPEYSLMSESVAVSGAAPEPPPRSKRRKSYGLTVADNSTELHASSSSGNLSLNEVNVVEVKGQDNVNTQSSDYDNNNYINTVTVDTNCCADSAAFVHKQEKQSPTTSHSSLANKDTDGNDESNTHQIPPNSELDLTAEPELPVVPPPSVFFKDEPESRLEFSSDEDCETDEIPVNSSQMVQLEDSSVTTVILITKSTINDDQINCEERTNTPPIPATPPPILSTPPSTRPQTLPLPTLPPSTIPVTSPMPILLPPSPYAGSVDTQLIALQGSASIQRQIDNDSDNAAATVTIVSESLPTLHQQEESVNADTDADDEDIYSGFSEEERKLIASVLRSDHTKTLDVLNECVEINQKILQQTTSTTNSEIKANDKEPETQPQVGSITHSSQLLNTSDTSDNHEQPISNSGQVKVQSVPSGVGVKTQLQKTPSDSRLNVQPEKTLDEERIKGKKDWPQNIPDDGVKPQLQKISSNDQLQRQIQPTPDVVEVRTQPQNVSDDRTKTETQKASNSERDKGQLQQTAEAAEIKGWQCDVTDSRVKVKQQDVVVNQGEGHQQKTSDEFTHYISLIQGPAFNSVTRKPGPIQLPPQVSMDLDDDSETQQVTMEKTRKLEAEIIVLQHPSTLQLINGDVSMPATNSNFTEKQVDIDVGFCDTTNDTSRAEVAASIRETTNDISRSGADNDVEPGVEGDDVFSVCSGTSSSTDAVTGSDPLSKSRRMLSSDQCVSDVMKAYYNEEEELAQPQEEDAKKNKPKKPLIAQALLPKSARVSTTGSGAALTVPVSPSVTGGNLSSEQWQQQKRELTGITPVHNNVRLHHRGGEAGESKTTVTVMADGSPVATGSQMAETKASMSGSSSSDIPLDEMKKDKPNLEMEPIPNKSSTSGSESIDVVVLPSVSAARKLFESHRVKLPSPSTQKATRSKVIVSTSSSVSSETDQEETKNSVSSQLPPQVTTSDVKTSGLVVVAEIGFPDQTATSTAENDGKQRSIKADISAGSNEPDSAGLPGVAAARALFESRKHKSSPFGLTKQSQKTTATKQPMPATGVQAEQKNESVVSVVGKQHKEIGLTPANIQSPECSTPDSIDSSSVSSTTSTAAEVTSSASSDSGIETSSVATAKAFFTTQTSKVGNSSEKKFQGSNTGRSTTLVPATSEASATLTASSTGQSSDSDILTEMPNPRAFFESMQQHPKRQSTTTGRCGRSASLNTTRPGPPVPHKTKHPSISGAPSTTNQSTASISTNLPADQTPSTTATIATATTIRTTTTTATATATNKSWTKFSVKSPAVRPQHNFHAAAHTNHTESPGSNSEPTGPVDTDSNLSVAASKALFESRKSTDKSSSVVKGGQKHSADGSSSQTSVGRSASMSASHHNTPTSNSSAASGSSSLHPRPSFTSTDSSNSLKAWKSFISSYAAVGKEESK